MGGKLTRELASSRVFEKWAETAIADGRAVGFDNGQVDTEADHLAANWSGKSNVQHVIALARVSGARVLFAADGGLRDTELVPRPPQPRKQWENRTHRF